MTWAACEKKCGWKEEYEEYSYAKEAAIHHEHKAYVNEAEPEESS